MQALRTLIISAASIALLNACGGGGSSSGGTNPPVTGPNDGWVAGVYDDASQFENQCANPRSGTDPATGSLYSDRQGSGVDEKNWLRSWSNDTYLWYQELPDLNPENDYSEFITERSPTEPNGYFSRLRTTATTPSGKDKDNFHFVLDSQTWYELSQGGVSFGYGIEFAVLVPSPPRDVRIAYSQNTSQAAQLGMTRGTKIIAIDGEPVLDGDPNILNAGLSPDLAGEEHDFEVLLPGALETQTFTLTAAEVAIDPLQNVKVIPTATGNVGYMAFHDHIAPAELALINATQSLSQQGISDLVIDLRYNGGGYLDIASELGYMIAGNATLDRTFELLQFNDKYRNVNPVTGQTISPIPFHTRARGFSAPENQPLPTLGGNLNRVFLLTGSGTCSASEALINGLRGINFDVIQIGATTCGKPYGYYPTPNCGSTYFTVQFKGVNAAGFGDYPDGFTPSSGGDLGATEVTGCYVADDFDHALGDSGEARLAAALYYRDNGTCPPALGTQFMPSGGSGAPLGAGGQSMNLLPAEPSILKTPARRMRIL